MVIFITVAHGRADLLMVLIAPMLENISEQNTDLVELQHLLLEAVFDEDALDTALKKFADICGAPISQLMVAQRNRTLLKSVFSQELENDIAETEALYQNINPRVLATPSMPQGKVTRDQDFISYEDISADQTYQELILPAGLGHFSAVPLIHDDEMTAGIALHRRFTDAPFSDEEARLHEMAASVCEPVLRLAALIEKRNVRNSIDLIADDKAVAILDQTGRVLAHNEAFETLITGGAARINSDRLLQLSAKTAQMQLARALGTHTGIVGGAFALRSRTKQRQWLCRVTPKPAFTLAGPEVGHALLICEQVEKPPTLDVGHIRDFFGLTHAESEIAALVFQGLAAKDIAAARNVSPETVRSHIKNLLNKTECNRQVELVAKLARFTHHTPT